jgi:hypothetical protein
MPRLRSFIGGMNVPVRGGRGRMNATIPLALLIVDDDWLTLQPRWFATLITGPFRTPLSAVVAAYPVHGRLAGGGIGLTTTDEQTAYFWTRHAGDEILRTLAARGIAIDPVARRPVVFRQVRSPRPSITQVAELRPWLVRILPLGMLAGTVVAIILAASSTSLLWRAWVAVVWVISLTTTFRLWRGSRHRG